MGRKRHNRKDERLPKYVYRGKSAYEYRPYRAGQKREVHRLCDLNSTTLQVWAAYEELTNDHRVVKEHTLESLSNLYRESAAFKDLSPLTQKDYTGYHNRIMRFLTNTGIPFGQVQISHITPGSIRSYLDKRPRIGGNREKSYISVIFSWAYNRDIVDFNPAKGVKGNPEPPRNTYVDKKMYDAFYETAKSPWYVRPMMEVAYLCRMRRCEILDLKKSDILPEGLNTRRSKNSNDSITLWSDKLRKAIDVGLNYKRKIDSLYIFADKNGQPITDSAFTSAWDRASKRYTGKPFTFHDLKAKGVSDVDGDKQAASGHKSARMVAVYDRKKKKVKATE